MRMLVALIVEDTPPAAEATNQGVNQKGFSRALLMIPTLNEAEAVRALVLEAKECGLKNILVVDGFSTDGTGEVAAEAGATVQVQEFGTGKGCGVRTGMKAFLQGNADMLCIIDGDGTNIPSDLRAMLLRLEDGNADVVLGSRIRGKRAPRAMSTLAFCSNLTVSFLLGAKFRRLFTDIQTGYWSFTREAVRKIYPLIHSTGFEIEIELFVTALEANLRVCEVPVGFRIRKGTTKFSFPLRMRNLYFALKYLVP
jgi:dolichol-phosphate mannosyltransferase